MDEIELHFLKEITKMNTHFTNDFFPKPIKNHFTTPKYLQPSIQKGKTRYIDSDGFEHYYSNEAWHKKLKPMFINYNITNKNLEISCFDFDFLKFKLPHISLFDWFNDHQSGMGFYGGEMKDGFVGDKIGKKGSFYGWESNPQTFGTSPNAGATISQIKTAVKVGKYLKNAASIKSSFEDKNKIDMGTVEQISIIIYLNDSTIEQKIWKKHFFYGQKINVDRDIDSITRLNSDIKKEKEGWIRHWEK